MGEQAEALAQLARLLGDRSLPALGPSEVRQTVAAGVDRLAAALAAEVAASDDVYDKNSAFLYLEERLQFLEPLVGADNVALLRIRAAKLIEAW